MKRPSLLAVAALLCVTSSAHAVHDRMIGEQHEMFRIPPGSQLKFSTPLLFLPNGRLTAEVSRREPKTSLFGEATLSCGMQVTVSGEERYASRERGGFPVGTGDTETFELLETQSAGGGDILLTWRSPDHSRILVMICDFSTQVTRDHLGVGPRRDVTVGDFRALFGFTPYILIDSSVDLSRYAD